MRTSLLSLLPVLAVALLAVTSCDKRDSINVTPDREGHARNEGGATGQIGTGNVPTRDEQMITVQPGEKLMDISKKYNTSIETITKRNNLTSNTLVAGTNLIVNKPGVRR